MPVPFLVDSVPPKPGRVIDGYDLILASQPWRATATEFKVQEIRAPLAGNLAPGGRLVAIQSCGLPLRTMFRYELHTLPSEIGDRVGRSGASS